MLGKLDRYVQKNKTRPPSYTHIQNPRINWKGIKDLNVRPVTIKIVEENIGSKILDVAPSNILLDIYPQEREKKEKKNPKTKWDYMKLKSFCIAKKKNKIKRQPTEWENIFANTSDKGWISKIYKLLIKLNTKKTNNPIKNGQRTWVDTFPKRTYR